MSIFFYTMPGTFYSIWKLTLKFQKVIQRRHWCVLGSLLITLLQIYFWVCQWKIYESLLIIVAVMKKLDILFDYSVAVSLFSSSILSPWAIFLLYLQCESKKSTWRLVAIFPKRLGIFQPNFKCLLRVPIYARLRIFIQVSATLTKLCRIKRDHPSRAQSVHHRPKRTLPFSDIFPKQLGFLVQILHAY